jgi:hypothetical protein
MESIRKLVNTEDKFQRMMELLVRKIHEGDAVSDNSMLDGMIIGFMLSTERFTCDLFLNKDMGCVLDGTMQRLEHIAYWVCENEVELCRIFENSTA